MIKCIQIFNLTYFKILYIYYKIMSINSLVDLLVNFRSQVL